MAPLKFPQVWLGAGPVPTSGGRISKKKKKSVVFSITKALLPWLKRIEKMSYFGGPALVHQVNILVSSDPKQAQACWCSKNKQASITAHLCSASET